jgi:N-acetylmuramoyl-L-alanine amidase
MRKLWIGAAMAALLVTGCQAGTFHGADGTKNQAVVRESGAGDTAAPGNYVNSADAADQVSRSSRPIVITSEPAVSMTNTDDMVTVTGSQVNIRSSATTASQSLGTVSQGETLKRTGKGDSWSRVVYNGKEAYISNSYITVKAAGQSSQAADQQNGNQSAASQASKSGGPGETIQNTSSVSQASSETVAFSTSWKYAEFSKISSGTATLYRSTAAVKKNHVICVNAGHGTKGGSSVKTQCHPDGSAKVTGGTTGAGATSAVAVSSGMTFADGTPESQVTLAMAKKLKEKLLAAGYDVLMIRENDDVQLDNIARTVMANNMADCHIALHWDSTEKDKGAFYMSVPNVTSYRSMEPVASNWQKHNALGESLVAGLKNAGVKIFSSGAMEMDLTQTSFSTIPSIDIELGDKKSDHSDAVLNQLADGLLNGINRYFMS